MVAAAADDDLLVAACAIEKSEALLTHPRHPRRRSFLDMGVLGVLLLSQLLSGNDTQKARATTRAFTLFAAIPPYSATTWLAKFPKVAPSNGEPFRG